MKALYSTDHLLLPTASSHLGVHALKWPGRLIASEHTAQPCPGCCGLEACANELEQAAHDPRLWRCQKYQWYELTQWNSTVFVSCACLRRMTHKRRVLYLSMIRVNSIKFVCFCVMRMSSADDTQTSRSYHTQWVSEMFLVEKHLLLLRNAMMSKVSRLICHQCVR